MNNLFLAMIISEVEGSTDFSSSEEWISLVAHNKVGDSRWLILVSTIG